MAIKKWLKNKYWLWGILFGVILVELAGFYHYFTAAFPRWDYRYAALHSFPYAIFFAIISELFFRFLKKFKRYPPAHSLRIFFLVLVILFSTLFVAGLFVSTIWPFLD